MTLLPWRRLLLLSALLLAGLPAAQAGYSTLWTLGAANDTPEEFTQENGSSNAAPGSATAVDDDYYFAGTYPAPVGVSAGNELTANFERSVTTWDPTNRLHFNLSAAQAAPTARFRLTFGLVWGGWWNAAASTSGKDYGTHTLRVKMNGQILATQTFTGDGVMIVTANATQALPVAGANTIEITRTGGTQDAWIAFDSLSFEVNPTALTDADGDGLPEYWEQEHALSDSDPADAARDQDRDGVSTLSEFARGTDPNNADTDGDGLNDGYEVFTALTNPLLADSDTDGLSDSEEVLTYLTNPLLADSDGDGAPDNWEVRTGYNPNSNTSTPPAFPYAIGVKFVSDLNPSNTLAALDVAGFVPQMRWNNSRPLRGWSLPAGNNSDIASPSAGVLVNSAGVPSGVTLAWTSANAWLSGNGGSANQRLLDGYLNADSSAPASLTLSGISFPTYDVLIYVGNNYDGSHGYARLNDNTATDRHFYSGSTRPEAGFLEPVGSTAAKPWRGNLIRYRNVSGTSCNVKVFASGSNSVGIHGIQIVHATADSDGDGMPDWWELSNRLKPDSAADAVVDPDGDGLSNLQEFTRATNPRLADTDSDGLSDLVETATGTYLSASNTGSNPLLPDSDGDGLTDGEEVLTYLTNPLLADTDSDGRSDFTEVKERTDPLVSNATAAFMPVVTISPRTFHWTLDNVQLLWDHSRGQISNQEYGDAYLFSAAITNSSQSAWWDSLRVGLRVVGGRLVHFLYSGSHGAFSSPSSPGSDLWESDWNSLPTDQRAALGFSGYGKADYSARLRFDLSATSTGAANAWTLTYEIRNTDSNQVVVTKVFVNCTLASDVHNNTATWQNNDDPAKANRLSLYKYPGVEVYFQATPLATTPAFAAYKDTDKDGMPDLWEDAHGFNKNSAGDAAADTDSDGLTNLKEFLAGTDPRNADSDGDLVPDGAELTAGSDPLKASSKPPFYSGLPAGVTGEDFNNNGIPDAYEQWLGTFNLQGGADSDGDGFSDAREAAAGTNPLNPASHPWADLLHTGSNLTLRWPVTLYKQHQVWQSADMVSWTPVAGTPTVVGSEFRQTFSDGGSTRGFYRVSINDLDSDGDGVSNWTEINVLGSDPNSANSLRSAAVIDSNHDGVPETTLSGDYLALLERFQGGSSAGGFASGASGGSTGAGISRTQAARFLTQATFGPSPADIERLQQLGYPAWIDEQISRPITLHSTYIKAIYTDYRGAHTDTSYISSDTDNFIYGNNLTTAFARAAVQGQDQLRQRVAFALSQILVASRRDAALENTPQGMADFYDIFVRHAFGNYSDVLSEVALHPCMGRYLSHVGNQKANPAINQYPDENFARELMQLFTIGLWELNADGSRKVDALGQNIPTYSNTEITQTARVMTGLWFSGHEWGNGGYSDADYSTPMGMHPDRHDFGQKTLVRGYVIPARAANREEALRDVSDALRNLFTHPNCGPFICKQLIQFLVTDNPTPSYIQRVAAKFADNGSGVRGDLSAVVKAILLDVEARDPRAAENNPGFGRLKEPVLRTMAMARAFGLQNATNLLWWDWGDYFATSRQSPTYSPSVFNFYRPDYRAAGLLTQYNLAGPVFQITDSYSSIAFPNRIWSDLQSGFSYYESYQFPFNFSTEASLAATPALLVDHLNTLFCGGRLGLGSRNIILNAINAIPASQPEARARVAAYLILVSPEGAVMK